MPKIKQLHFFGVNRKNSPDLIPAERHPKRYESHKYWGRKSYNIVRKYIEKFSRQNQLILDPFCGSGVIIFESLALKRNAIGYDLNPIAYFITQNLIETNIDTELLYSIGSKILQKLESEFPYYDVACDCGETGKLINGIWKRNNYMAKYYQCPKCGNKMSATTSNDLKNVAAFRFPSKLWYPKEKLPENADANYVHELFTKRNLLALSLLIREIKKIRILEMKNLLLYTFTANIAFTSKIIPVNMKRFKQKRNCTGIWGFKRYWIPEFHVENNVFRYFRTRLSRTIKAKEETNNILKNTKAVGKTVNKSAVKLKEIEPKTADLIFTDPPFGNMIPYFNLSTLWNSWLNFKVDHKNEIIIDNRHSDSEYYTRMLAVFKQGHRVLKDNKYLLLAFNNKNIKVWCLLLDAVHNAGFRMKECFKSQDGEASFTQTTKSARGSLRGHFVYVFRKEKTKASQQRKYSVAIIKNKIVKEITKYIGVKRRTITEIYNHIIPYMVNNKLLDKNLENDIIDRVLKEKCDTITQIQTRIIEGEKVDLKSYYFQLKTQQDIM